MVQRADGKDCKLSFTMALERADALVAHTPLNRFIADGFCAEGQLPKPVFNLNAFEQISSEMLFWLRDRLHGRAML
jgi:hypothetical protein